MVRLKPLLCVSLVLVVCPVFAKSSSPSTFTWPQEGQALVRLTFSRFSENENVILNGGKVFSAEVLAENLWEKPIHVAVFRVFCFDKHDVRNGETLVTINELPAGGKSKLPIQVNATSTPDHVQLEPLNVPSEFAAAKYSTQVPGEVITWPREGEPLARFTIGTLRQIGGYNGQDNFTADVLTENVWSKPIHLAAFHVYFFDSQGVRIGESFLSVNDLATGGKTKSELNLSTRGKPTRLEVVPVNVPDEFAALLPKKEIAITVNSLPQGATLSVDGRDEGTTPRIVKFTPGKHVLSFALSGYTSGTYPFEVRPEDASGGSVNFEMGAAMHDTVELRDGSVLTGDIETLSATEMEISIGGSIQKLNRNSIKRILLIERMPPSPQAK